MTSVANTLWLPLYALVYVAVMLFWSRVAARENAGWEGFFSAGHSLAPWLSALVSAGVSLSGWFMLGGSRQIAEHGFSSPALLTAGITLALPGVLLFKRLWFVAERLRLSSQAGIFRVYYGSAFLVAVSTAVAVLFAIGFCGLQLRVLALDISQLTGNAVSQLAASVVLGFILFAGIGIGGMRSICYFGVIQTVLAFAAMMALAAFALLWSGGFTELNTALRHIAAMPGGHSLFNVSRVIDFTAGLGRGSDPAKAGTALANLSLAFALMGFQASPLVLKIILSTRSPNAIAAGQTWITAGFFGGLIAFAIAATGAAGLVDRSLSPGALLERMQTTSPWFAAWTFAGMSAGVLLLAGLALFVAAEMLVRHIYKPYFHSALSKSATVTLTRVVIAVMAALTMVMQNLTPVTLSALSGLALPIAFQLWTPLLGIAWLDWITRPAAITGVGFGIAGVVLTEPFGYQILSFLGLELPWGRWPWTIHSAAWGMAANIAAVLIISAITNREAVSDGARDVRRLLSEAWAAGTRTRPSRSLAWSVVLAWFFLATGPGLIFGNSAFMATSEQGEIWILGMPPIWAWALSGWVSGVGLIWFLSYRMEMASPTRVAIQAYVPVPRLRKDQSRTEGERRRRLIITGAIGFVLVVLITFSFGS